MQIGRPTQLTPMTAPAHCAPELCTPRDLAGVATPDRFEFTRHDLTGDGRIPLIVYSPSPSKLEGAESFLEGSANGSTLDRVLPLVNGFSARVSPKDLKELFHQLPSDAGVRLNSRIVYPDPSPVLAKDVATPNLPTSAPAPPATAASDTARQTIGIEDVWAKGYTGKGIGVAIIDSGIYPHDDVKGKISAWIDVADGKAAPYDSFGHGTHVAGDVAGTGAKSGGQLKGTAPDAHLVGIRITTVAEAIKGIEWAIENKATYNIRVINMSLGDFASKSYKDDPWAQATQKAIDAGITVVVAAGNEGPDPGSISTPATSPNAITVGALDDKHTLDRSDDAMAPFSSRGPTSVDNITKPDVIAPGVGVFAPLAPDATLDVPELPHIGNDYIAISGTSMATPLVSGLVADLLQANPNLTPEQVKSILTSTADHYLSDDANGQGAGLVDAPKALQMALDLGSGAAGKAAVA